MNIPNPVIWCFCLSQTILYTFAGPMVPEMSGKCWEYKLQQLEATQKTILSRLERLERIIEEQYTEKGAEQSSMYSISNTVPFASSPSSHCQGAPQLSSPFAHLQHPLSYPIDENIHTEFVPGLNEQHQFSFPLDQPTQAQFTVPHTIPTQFNVDQPTAPQTARPEFNVDQPTQPQFSLPHTTTTRQQPFFQCTTNALPKVLPISPISRKPSTICLSSSEINKKGLQTTDTFFISHRNLKGESKAGMLSVRLAKKVYFGEEVRGKCTVSGLRGLPGLPVAELGELKQTIFLQFPQFWQNPVEFEQLWSKCADAINQSCKKIRQEQQQRK